MDHPRTSGGQGGSFRRYAVPGVTAARLAAACLVTLVLAVGGTFAVVGSPGLAGVGVAAALAVICLALWTVVLRQPWSITVGDEVVIRLPLVTRRYARADIQRIEPIVRSGGTMALGMHTSRTRFWIFRMRDGRCYSIPVRPEDGDPA